MSSLARQYNIPRSTLMFRLSKGMTLEQAATTISKNKEVSVRIKGEMLTLNQIVEKYDINKGTIRGRIALGWREDDLIKPVRYRKGYETSENGSAVIKLLIQGLNVEQISSKLLLSRMQVRRLIAKNISE